MINKMNISLKGFSLLETLVAVMILSTAIVGPLSIASRSLHNSIVAKDQIAAFFLAQDAVEFIRYARDSNTLKGGNWITGAGTSTSIINLSLCEGTYGCYFDSTGSTITACTLLLPCPVINYNTSTGFYTYSPVVVNDPTIVSTSYTRQVFLTATVANVEEKITVLVTWKDSGGSSHTVTVSENIFNWQ